MAYRKFYSTRKGKNPNADGFNIVVLRELFSRLFQQLKNEGYFSEAFGFFCVDQGYVPGSVMDPEYEVLIKTRKKDVWPVEQCCGSYTEHDLFDIMEFLYDYVSQPISGRRHDYNQCGMHWEKFDKGKGQEFYREKIEELLALYSEPFCFTEDGEILEKPEKGFEKIFEADVPSTEDNITMRVDAAIRQFRRHGVSVDERRHAVRDLADVLEYLRPRLKELISSQDESDLFNIANNFGIRHHNERQKTNYDAKLWLSWMFYHYLSTIHVVLRRIEHHGENQDERP